MKAYIVSDKTGYSEMATVVFAESRNAAKYAAMNTEACDGLDYTEISAIREPALDQFYKEGKKEMDWFDMEERAAMVRYARFACNSETDISLLECKNCPGHKWCGRYDSEREEMEELEREET